MLEKLVSKSKNLVKLGLLCGSFFLTSCTTDKTIIKQHYGNLMTAKEFAEELHTKDLDDFFTTPAEEYFEKEFPNINLFGPKENMKFSQIRDLRDWINQLPKKTFNKYKFDIILAYRDSNNSSFVDYGNLEEGGRYLSDENTIIMYSHSRSLLMHEFAHAFHLADNEVTERINKQWKNIETIIDNKKIKMKDLYGKKDLLGPGEINEKPSRWHDEKTGPRHGFVSPYAMNNIKEDVADTAEGIYDGEIIDCLASLLVVKKKADILLKEEFFSKNIYSAWFVNNLDHPSIKNRSNEYYKLLIDTFKEVDHKYINILIKNLPGKKNKFVNEKLESIKGSCSDYIKAKIQLYLNKFVKPQVMSSGS